MILLVGIVLGLAAGLARARWGKRPYLAYNLKVPWLVLIGFALQFFTFNFPPPFKKNSKRMAEGLDP